VLSFVVIGETAVLVVTVVIYFFPDVHACCGYRVFFKEGHAAKSAEERRHNNHNMRAHLGKNI
jgi:predicted aminopeptidase